MAVVFDKLNQVYKEYLEAEQTYSAVSHAPPGHTGPSPHRPLPPQGARTCNTHLVRVSQAMEAGSSRGSAAHKRPIRTQAVVDQSDMYTHVLSPFTEGKVRGCVRVCVCVRLRVVGR